MASISVKSTLSDLWMPDLFDSPTLALQPGLTTTSLTFADTNGASIVFSGSGFTEEDTGSITGIIKSVTFKNSSGQTLMTISGLAIPANNALGWLFDGADIFQVMSVLGRGNDTIYGSTGNDNLLPGLNFGNDKIYGLSGFDYISGSGGSNIMDGGADHDTLSYSETYFDSNAYRGIILNATLGTVTNSWGGIDTIKNFEEFEGSRFRDTMVGSLRDEVFKPLGGRDTIDGGKGVDEIRFNKDSRFGGNLGVIVDFTINTSGINAGYGTATDGFGKVDRIRNIEQAWGTDQSDTFIGDAKDNRFRGGDGADSYTGGIGSDTIDLRGFNGTDNGATVDLTLGSSQIANDGFGNVETVNGIENIHGTELADTIKLGTGAGWVYGDEGNDTLIAGSSTAWQWFGGGAGADTFVFTEATLTDSDGPYHLVDDFSQTELDKVDLSAFGGITFIGTSAFSGGAAAEVNYTQAAGKTYLNIDEDGDGLVDDKIMFNGTITFTGSDLILT